MNSIQRIAYLFAASDVDDQNLIEITHWADFKSRVHQIFALRCHREDFLDVRDYVVGRKYDVAEVIRLKCAFEQIIVSILMFCF